jgi:HSP20 family molecular chaperone IbpA
MGFFDNDGFGIEDFFKNFAGGEGFIESSSVGPDGKRKVFRRSSNDTTKIPKNQVLTKKNVFFIYDLSGFEKINVEIKDEEVMNDYNEKVHTGNKALEVSNGEKIVGNFSIPKEIKVKGFEWTFNNGILEVIFRR